MRGLWYCICFDAVLIFCCASCGTEKVCKQLEVIPVPEKVEFGEGDRKSTRLNSSHS